MKIIRAIGRRILPRPVRRSLRKAYWLILDGMDKIVRPNHLLPPRSMIFIGDGDFEKTGKEFLVYFQGLGGLSPKHKVLDVGSGIGRMALPLIPYLSMEGSYDGLEIVPMGVKWCQQKITPRHPHFRFHLIDVYNLEYNPDGKIKATEYRFPFPDRRFNFVFLTSVFTHMLPADFESYVTEISRVTLDGGRCFATFFLLNDVSREKIGAGIPFLKFQYEGNGFLTNDPQMPESAIAFPEEYVLKVFKKHGFSLSSPIHYGSWCGREGFLSYQDILIFEKVEHAS